jgi:DNA replication protein DnaC
MRKTDWKRNMTAEDVERMHESLRQASRIAAAREEEQKRMQVGTTAAEQRERLRQQKMGHDRKLRFRIPDAKAWMERGLQYFLGERAQWLPCYDEVAAWLADNQGRGLFCYGQPSLGKTVLTTKVIPMIFRESLGLSFPCYKGFEMADNYQQIITARCIIIDDVGREDDANVFGVRHNYFEEIVHKCEDNDRLLITSTNCNKQELLDRYGLPVMERIKAVTVRVKFIGESFRK